MIYLPRNPLLTWRFPLAGTFLWLECNGKGWYSWTPQDISNKRSWRKTVFLPESLLDLRLDRAGGLWVVGDTSLTRINPNRSISVFDHENGLPKSIVAATVRYGGYLYAATWNGLYRLEPCGERPSQFRKVPGITDWLYNALAAPPHGLLLTGEKGVYLFDGNGFQVVSKIPLNFSILRSKKNPERFFVGGYGGLRTVRFLDGHWIEEGAAPGFDRKVSSIVETAEGNLFVGTMSDGYFLIQPGPNLEKPLDGPRVESLPNAPKAGAMDMCSVQALGERVLFSSDKEILLFQDAIAPSTDQTFSRSRSLAVKFSAWKPVHPSLIISGWKQ